MPRVTLTFDNGPTTETTPFVLAQLQERALSAWFCLVGSQLLKSDEHAGIARHTLASGHRLVNHSMTHSVALGDDPGAAHARREVTDMHVALCDTLGDWGESWFRPFGRGGAIGKHILSRAALDELQRNDYSMLLWNCVPRDWEDTQGWVETALLELGKQDHTVIVLHDLNTGAMQQLPRFLDTLLESGCQFTIDLPETCLPLRNGQIAWSDNDFNKLTSG